MACQQPPRTASPSRSFCVVELNRLNMVPAWGRGHVCMLGAYASVHGSRALTVADYGYTRKASLALWTVSKHFGLLAVGHTPCQRPGRLPSNAAVGGKGWASS